MNSEGSGLRRDVEWGDAQAEGTGARVEPLIPYSHE